MRAEGVGMHTDMPFELCSSGASLCAKMLAQDVLPLVHLAERPGR